jgi:hypothetical protein
MSSRRLPHVYPKGRWLFVTFHLHGSLPRAQYPPPHKLSAGQAFVWMDRRLDMLSSGPLFLRQEAIADLVTGSIWRGVELRHYQLGAFVVMANGRAPTSVNLRTNSGTLRALGGTTRSQGRCGRALLTQTG